MDYQKKCTDLKQNIAYLQSDHERVLQSLRNEVSSLQRKCADLTFQLAMAKSETAEVLTATEKQHQPRSEQSTTTLLEFGAQTNDASVAELNGLRDLIKRRNEEIDFLKQQIQISDQHREATIASYKTSIRTLKSEVDTRDQTINELTWQLQNLSNMNLRTASVNPLLQESLTNLAKPRPPPSSPSRPSSRHTSFRKTSTEAPSSPSGMNSLLPPTANKPLEPDPSPFLVTFPKKPECTEIVPSSLPCTAPVPPIRKQGSE